MNFWPTTLMQHKSCSKRQKDFFFWQILFKKFHFFLKPFYFSKKKKKKKKKYFFFKTIWIRRKFLNNICQKREQKKGVAANYLETVSFQNLFNSEMQKRSEKFNEQKRIIFFWYFYQKTFTCFFFVLNYFCYNLVLKTVIKIFRFRL